MEIFKIENKKGIRIVTIDNPRKKNALNKKGYLALAQILTAAAKDDEIKALILTGGKSDFFSSGNDLTQEVDASAEPADHFGPLKTMIEAFIRFPKLLIAIVNGPAIGIGATILALCDIIYAKESAYFYTPFTALGLCAEGCSSITFPKIFGTSKANEMLSLNHKLTASEALNFGFISSIYKTDDEIWSKLNQISDLPLGSIKANKMLMRKFTIDELERANLSEIEQLVERMGSEEALMAMLNFQASRAKKSKL